MFWGLIRGFGVRVLGLGCFGVFGSRGWGSGCWGLGLSLFLCELPLPSPPPQRHDEVHDHGRFAVCVVS